METPALCWICRQADATTGEHKYPAAFLRRIPDDWNDLHHGTSDGKQLKTPGPGSRNFKLPVLCAQCNNARTSAQDRALDAFLRYAHASEAKIWVTREVDLDQDPAQHSVLDLYRGLLKLEFSRLYSHGVGVAPPIADFVLGSAGWVEANAMVRVEFRVAPGYRYLSVVYPVESESLYYESPYFVSHQINFGWLGVHFLYAPSEHPKLPWPTWPMKTALLRDADFDANLRPIL